MEERQEEGGSLVDFVNEEATRGSSRRDSSPSDENRNLEPFARIGKDFHRLIPERGVSGNIIKNETLPLFALSPEIMAEVQARIAASAPPPAILGCGSMYRDGTSETTTITVYQTYYKVNVTTVAGSLMKNFTMSADNRLRYDGSEKVLVRVTGSISGTGAAASKQWRYVISKNGSVIPESVVGFFHVTGGVYKPTPLSAICQMEKDDYIEVWAGNWTDVEDLRTYLLSISVLAFSTPEFP